MPLKPPHSYSGYSAQPRFEGQAAAATVEDVPLFPWFTHVNSSSHHHTQLFMIGPGGLEKPNAFDLQLYGASWLPPWKFTMRTVENAGVAYATQIGGNCQKGGRNEVAIAKGMDAGLVVMAAFCPRLLDEEIHDHCSN